MSCVGQPFDRIPARVVVELLRNTGRDLQHHVAAGVTRGQVEIAGHVATVGRPRDQIDSAAVERFGSEGCGARFRDRPRPIGNARTAKDAGHRESLAVGREDGKEHTAVEIRKWREPAAIDTNSESFVAAQAV